MKLTEQHLLELRCRLEKFITEREGMIAENKQREKMGDSMAYSDQSFFNTQHKIEELENHICWFGEKREKE